MVRLFVCVTDKAWFDQLSASVPHDEVGQAVEDPLIASLNLADNVSKLSFSEILSAVARVLARK